MKAHATLDLYMLQFQNINKKGDIFYILLISECMSPETVQYKGCVKTRANENKNTKLVIRNKANDPIVHGHSSCKKLIDLVTGSLLYHWRCDICFTYVTSQYLLIFCLPYINK